MPNEFVISNGFISKDSSRIIGTLTATTITATTISGGTIYGNGSNINGINVNNYYFYPTGTTQHFQGEGKSWATYTLIANRFNGIPLEIKTDVVVKNLRWFITSPVSGDSVFGLYKIEKNSNGEPSTLLWQTSVFSNNVSGLQIYTFPTPQPIEAGFYVLAHHTSSNPQVRCTLWGAQSISNMGIVPAMNFTENLYYTWYGNINYSTYNGVLPSTWPVASTRFLANDTRHTLVGFTL